MRAARCPGSERGPRGRLLAPRRYGPPATWGQRPRRAGQRAAPPEQPGRAGPRAPGRSRPHPHPPRARTGFQTAAFPGNRCTGRPQRRRGARQGDRRRGSGSRFSSFRVGSLASSPPTSAGPFPQESRPPQMASAFIPAFRARPRRPESEGDLPQGRRPLRPRSSPQLPAAARGGPRAPRRPLRRRLGLRHGEPPAPSCSPSNLGCPASASSLGCGAALGAARTLPLPWLWDPHPEFAAGPQTR